MGAGGQRTPLSDRLHIAAAGLADRLSVLGGDVGVDAIGSVGGSDYDLVWCSSVLHFVPDTEAVLRKILAALRPGGALICAHAEIGDTPAAAVEVLQYYLPMLMQGRNVGHRGDMAAVLRRIGFGRIETFVSCLFPMAPLQVVVARKAA